jgi:DNA processing protein
LETGGRTIAVLAGGLSSIYPPEHADLAEAVARHGALLSETPMTVDPQAGMFPARNRIISGLSRAVVVVEANNRSGALITVTHAADQGREVYAVPGPVDSPASAGCLELIRKGARLVRSADDILEDLAGLAPPDPGPTPRPPTSLFEATPPASTTADSHAPGGLDPVQQRVWEALTTAKHADELSRELAMPAGALSVVLMTLEMKKTVQRLPGNRFERR